MTHPEDEPSPSEAILKNLRSPLITVAIQVCEAGGYKGECSKANECLYYNQNSSCPLKVLKSLGPVE